jgi:hypothetical protein
LRLRDAPKKKDAYQKWRSVTAPVLRRPILAITYEIPASVLWGLLKYKKNRRKNITLKPLRAIYIFRKRNFERDSTLPPLLRTGPPIKRPSVEENTSPGAEAIIVGLLRYIRVA